MSLRHILLINLLLSCSTFISAQWSGGLYLGLNNTNLTGDSPTNFRYRPVANGTFGATLNYEIKEDVRLSFQPGFSLVKPDIQWKDLESEMFVDSIRLSMNLIKLPIFFDVISDNKKWHFLAGVDFQILLRQFTEVNGDEVIDLSEGINHFNPTIYFGLGHRILLGKRYLEIDLRFGQGFLNLTSEENDLTSLVPRIKTSTVELILNYQLFAPDSNGGS